MTKCDAKLPHMASTAKMSKFELKFDWRPIENKWKYQTAKNWSGSPDYWTAHKSH